MNAEPNRRIPAPPIAVLVGVALIAAALLAVGLLGWFNRGDDDINADPGRLTETQPELPPNLVLPRLVDAGREWGLDAVALEAASDPMAGGVASADFDEDGDLDLVIANGTVAIVFWEAGSYGQPVDLDVDDAIGVTTADVDGDVWIDILISRAGDEDTIVWGGPWFITGEAPAVTELPTPGASSALLAAELSGDEAVDIVRLGRGTDDPVPDLLWLGDENDRRSFEQTELPQPDRFSLAGEILDVDLDGLLDIWITRDVGWDRGGDSVLSRKGVASGPWHDIAVDLGVALEVDSMGITIADLDGDGQPDAYVSDLGDNEQLYGGDGSFTTVHDTGAARIRSPGAPTDTVSSSWGSGASDVNLDGVLDLVVVNGGFPDGGVRNKISGTEVAVEEPPSILLGLGSGSFIDAWPFLGVDLTMVARGMTLTDVDGDGDDDIVIVDRRGGVTALRNDTVGMSLTVEAAFGCSTVGAMATVRSASGSYQTLLGGHTYGSGHGPQTIVGVGQQPLTIGVRWGHGLTTVEEVSVANGREVLTVEC